MALVTWTDENGIQQSQLALIGENNAHLLNGRMFGLSDTSTNQGTASDWLRDGIFEKINRATPSQKAPKKGK